MVDANLKIITELKLVLEEITNNKELKLSFVTHSEAFGRDRKLTLKRLVGIIINISKRSLSIELNGFFDVINDKPTTKGALIYIEVNCCLFFSSMEPV